MWFDMCILPLKTRTAKRREEEERGKENHELFDYILNDFQKKKKTTIVEINFIKVKERNPVSQYVTYIRYLIFENDLCLSRVRQWWRKQELPWSTAVPSHHQMLLCFFFDWQLKYIHVWSLLLNTLNQYDIFLPRKVWLSLQKYS